MRRRRGEVYEIVRRLLALRQRYRGYAILVVDRSTVSGLRRLPLEAVERVEGDALLLADGTVIPLHRVQGVVDSEGRLVWSRGGRGQPAGEEA